MKERTRRYGGKDILHVLRQSILVSNTPCRCDASNSLLRQFHMCGDGCSCAQISGTEGVAALGGRWIRLNDVWHAEYNDSPELTVETSKEAEYTGGLVAEKRIGAEKRELREKELI